MGSTKISQPAPPPAPSTRESFEAFRDIQPDLFQQQLEFAPLEAQQQLDLAQQFALPYAQIYKQAQEVLYPETTALQEQMAGQAADGMEQGLTDAERAEYEDYFKSNLGTNAGSGIGASYFANNMVQADQQRKDYYRNLGLSLAGRQPLSQPNTPATTNYMAGFTPNAVMGFDSQNYGAQAGAAASMFRTQGEFGMTPFQRNMGLIGGGLNMLGGLRSMGTIPF